MKIKQRPLTQSNQARFVSHEIIYLLKIIQTNRFPPFKGFPIKSLLKFSQEQKKFVKHKKGQSSALEIEVRFRDVFNVKFQVLALQILHDIIVLGRILTLLFLSKLKLYVCGMFVPCNYWELHIKFSFLPLHVSATQGIPCFDVAI